jgi:hypothetical protein
MQAPRLLPTAAPYRVFGLPPVKLMQRTLSAAGSLGTGCKGPAKPRQVDLVANPMYETRAFLTCPRSSRRLNSP